MTTSTGIIVVLLLCNILMLIRYQRLIRASKLYGHVFRRTRLRLHNLLNVWGEELCAAREDKSDKFACPYLELRIALTKIDEEAAFFGSKE